MHKKNLATEVHRGSRSALWGVLLLVPLAMGARDCERVVVGEDCERGACADGGTAGTGGEGEGEGCEYGGVRYATGVNFESSDGCNTCSCTRDGEAACTEEACEGCEYGGVRYAVGDGFPSTDGCNECGCNEGGTVACTLRACAGQVCGGLMGEACPTDEYCSYAPEARCGAADQTGFCAPRPEACDLNYLPVCGCDDQTYGNACGAAAAGVSVVHEGECDGGQSGAECGGLLGAGCADGEFCNYAPDAQCGAADQTGTCMAIPGACTREYAPVCGCDGNTYGNACAAQAESVSIVHSGECDGGSSTGQVCGGRGVEPCPRGEYCDYPADAMCGRADAPGVCAWIPEACTLELNPVCGCDGTTYSNPCAAASASVSVEYQGECQ